MEPTIPSGSEVRIAPCSREDVRSGDIVVASGPHGLVIHRAVNGGSSLVLRGDALPGPDGPLEHFEIFGRVVEVRPTTRLSQLARRIRTLGRRFALWR